jgi:hypothetical protein
MKVKIMAELPALQSVIGDRPVGGPTSHPQPRSEIGHGPNADQYLLGIENRRAPRGGLRGGSSVSETISYSAGGHYSPHHASHDDPTPSGAPSVAADRPWRAPVIHALPRIPAESSTTNDASASSWRPRVFHTVPR